MTVVVHQTFVYKGQKLEPGTVLTGSEAEALKAKPQFRRFHSTAHDKHYAHLPQDAIITPNSGLTPIIDELAEEKPSTSTVAPAPPATVPSAAAPAAAATATKS